MKSLILHPHAKINLGLRILGIRKDGYHEIRTRFQTISLTDDLEMEVTGGSLELKVTGAALPGDGSNLVFRAAESLRRLRRGLPGARIRLRKRIPVAAGLGGGSSDAAATLLGLDRLWGVGLLPGKMRELAADLGSDVPFFLEGGTMLGEGRGERLRPLPDLALRHLCLILPPYGVSTSEAYRRWDRAHPPLPELDPATPPAPPSELSGEPALGSLPNDLQEQVLDEHPELRGVLQGFRSAGAVAASVSGSGSALFGLFRSEEEAGTFLSSRNWGPLRALKCTSVRRGEYRASLGLEIAPHPRSS